MSAAKIAISIDHKLLDKLDYFISEAKFKTRSQAIQVAVSDTLKRLEHQRLAQECEKLNPAFEQKLADEDLLEDARTWPEF